MKILCILASVLALAGGVGAVANAAPPEDVGPATPTVGQVGKVFVTVDAASDHLNGDIRAHNDAIEAQNQAAQTAYQAQLAALAQANQAQQDAYTAALTAHDAKVAADMAAWRARVQACKGGDTAQCAQSRSD
ncbi:MAG TPA: hypothetical protein VGL73_05445 [Caulobacteraceae bacterium]